MAILTLEQLIDALKKFIGDRTDDEALSFMENVMDTVTAGAENTTKEELENKIEALVKEKEALVKEKEALDAEWRSRYKERFFERPIIESNDSLDLSKDVEPVTFEDLFEETEE